MKKYLIPILAIGTAVMIYIMITTGGSLKTSQTPNGILDLEFAFDTQHTDIVMTAWAPGNKTDAAIKNTYWDFLFLFCYSLFLFFTCKQLRTKFDRLNWKYKAGNFFAGAAIIAGLLDAGENFGMLQTLQGNGSNATALVTVLCCFIKWMLVLLVIAYVLIALLSKKKTVMA